MKKLGKSIVFGILFIILAFAITIQIRLTNSSESESSQTKATDSLRDEILALTDENTKLTDALQESIEKLDNVRDEVAKSDSSTIEIGKLIKKYSLLSGDQDVSGQGVIIKYKPYKNEYTADIAKDLRDIVNELKNAGIEAISVNGQRLVSTSAIEMVQNKIEINGVQISDTDVYTIKAIGNSEIMYSSLIRPGGTIENIETTGVTINITVEDNVEITKYSDM